MTASEAFNMRAALALDLRRNGLKLVDIARVLNLESKEQARRMVARGERNSRMRAAAIMRTYVAAEES